MTDGPEHRQPVGVAPGQDRVVPLPSFAGVKMFIRAGSRARKKGKAGYTPACGNEWVRGICEKPRIKCADCPNRRFLRDRRRDPLASFGVRDRRASVRRGRLSDASRRACFFLAVDFDKGLAGGCGAFMRDLPPLGLPAALERSRSGEGGHVWLSSKRRFLQPRTQARVHILTETMERRPDIGLDSYDRFFPNQDTLPQGGFGNLIALPLQKGPREQGIAFSSMRSWCRTPISGRFCRRAEDRPKRR